MQGLKRSIPRVAAASLVLGGSGCAATPAPSPAEVGLARCEGASRCDPTYFATMWNSSLDECTDYYLDGYDEYLAQYYMMYMRAPDPACLRARRILEGCIADEYYDTWYNGACDLLTAVNACEDEQDRATRACGI